MQDRTTVVRVADEDDQISETVIYAVAAARDVCPTELETPLYDAVDPDMLKQLVGECDGEPDRDDVRVEFTWTGCDVVVDGSGRVVVTGAAAPSNESDLLLS